MGAYDIDDQWRCRREVKEAMPNHRGLSKLAPPSISLNGGPGEGGIRKRLSAGLDRDEAYT